MQNLVVNGCSFTQETDYTKSWATFLNNKIKPNSYLNLAQAGAGNKFICDSTITLLETQNIDPTNTLIIVMWSGVGRKDLHISKTWFDYLKEDYPFLCEEWIPTEEVIKYDKELVNNNVHSYYLHSGGLTCWSEHKETKKIFNELYKTSDAQSDCIENLLFFIQLESYLKQNNYKFVFTNYYNPWSKDNELTKNNDYSIGYHCSGMPIYENFDFKHWWFIDDEKKCLGEFAIDLNHLEDDGFHPDKTGHSKFADSLYSHILDNKFHMQ